MKKAENIMLGKGVFAIDGVDIGLTRDGGTFSVEYENRVIEADGDRGTVKGRVIREKATPKLEITHLELLTGLEKMHPGLKKDSSTKPNHEVYTGTGKIVDGDYHKVTFTGETTGGKAVVITVSNAINLENISWELKDKNDVLDKVTFEGCYEENASDPYAEPWEVDFGVNI